MSQKENNKKSALIAYVPVLHQGYRLFFERHRGEKLFVLGKGFINDSEYLRKEIRALDPEAVRSLIDSWKIFDSVEILEESNLNDLENFDEIFAAREDATEEFLAKHFPQKIVAFEEVFLRWDKHNTVRDFPVNPDIKISRDDFDKQMMLEADIKSKESSDWWRRVGSVVIKDNEIIISAANAHVPSQHMPYANGDPRSCFHKGMHLELSTAIHSEAACIAEAARKGISLEGTSMYVTNFPCPPCAKSIAYSGIKKLYYNMGYGVLDGESILKDRGVEIVLVDMELPQEKSSGTIPYKK